MYSISCLNTSGSNSSMIRVWCCCGGGCKAKIRVYSSKAFIYVHTLFACCIGCMFNKGSELRLMKAFNLLSVLTDSFFLGSSFLTFKMLWKTLKIRWNLKSSERKNCCKHSGLKILKQTGLKIVSKLSICVNVVPQVSQDCPKNVQLSQIVSHFCP